MSDEHKNAADKRQFINAIFIPAIVGIMMVLSFLLEKGMDWDFHTAGIYPRRIESLSGILTLIFVHADWGHLTNNLISFMLLGTFLYYFYMPIATKVLVISYLVSGLILWIIGRDSWHIGASGLIYSIAFFLFFSGIIRKHTPLIALSLVVVFIYGSMIWHIFPWKAQDPISWEGHLAGGIVGSALSVFYRKDGPQKPIKQWEDEEDESADSLEYLDDNVEKELD